MRHDPLTCKNEYHDGCLDAQVDAINHKPSILGLTTCLNADGRPYKAHEPDQWSFCPYCGKELPVANQGGCTCSCRHCAVGDHCDRCPLTTWPSALKDEQKCAEHGLWKCPATRCNPSRAEVDPMVKEAVLRARLRKAGLPPEDFESVGPSGKKGSVKS